MINESAKSNSLFNLITLIPLAWIVWRVGGALRWDSGRLEPHQKSSSLQFQPNQESHLADATGFAKLSFQLEENLFTANNIEGLK